MKHRIGRIGLLGILLACEPAFGPEDIPGDRDLPARQDPAPSPDLPDRVDLPLPGDLPGPDGPDLDAAPDQPPPDVPGDLPETGPLPDGDFATPEGIALADRYVVVANPAFRYDGQRMVFGTGFLTVVDRGTRQVVQRVALPCRNPQEVSWDGSRLWALCSGETSFDGTLVRPAGQAALVGLDLSGTPFRIVSYLPVSRSASHPLVGYPSSMALRDGLAYLGCGTTAAVLVADLDGNRLVRSPEDPWSLAALGLSGLEDQDTVKVLPGPQGMLLAGSFNRDLVVAFGVTGEVPTPAGSLEVGVPGMLDGVLDLAWRPGGTPELYVLLGLAQRVVAASDLLGSPRMDDRFAVTGTMPNRLLLDRDRLWILDSGDNRATAVDADTGKPLGLRAAMPPGTNPYALAAGDFEGRRELYVTGLRSDSLWIFDADTGALLAEVPPGLRP